MVISNGDRTETVGSTALRRRPVATTARPRRAALAVLALAGFWALVLLLDLLGLEAVLPVLVLVGVTGLVRSGTTLFTRLLCACGLLLGGVIVAGLLFSVWPWGLDPVPATLLGGTLVWAGAVATGRRPAYPRLGIADLPLVGLLPLAWLLARPLLQADGVTGRLAVMMAGEDNARHLPAFAAIGRAGGYLFLGGHGSQTGLIAGMDTYPQGWHLSAAFLDGFLRPAGSGGGLADFDHYALWLLATEVLLVAAIVRLAQLVARPRTVLAQVAVIGVTAAIVLGSEMTRLMMAGYAPEVLGVALFVLLVTLMLEEPLCARESLLRASLLLIGIGFTYYLFLVPAGLVVLAWLWWQRDVLLGHRVTLTLTAVAAVVLSPVIALLGASDAVSTGALETPGDGPPVYLTVSVLGAACLIGLITVRAERRAVWYLLAAAVLAPVLVGVGLAIYSTTGYYYHKVLHLSMALLIAGAGALAGRLPLRVERRRDWWRPTVVAVAVVAATAGASGVTRWGPGVFTDDLIHTNWWHAWTGAGYRSPLQAGLLVRAYRAFPPDDVPTVVVDSNGAVGYQVSVYLAALQRTGAQTQSWVYVPQMQEPQRLQRMLEVNDGPVRLIATTPDAKLFATGIVKQADDPDRVRLVELPGS